MKDLKDLFNILSQNSFCTVIEVKPEVTRLDLLTNDFNPLLKYVRVGYQYNSCAHNNDRVDIEYQVYLFDEQFNTLTRGYSFSDRGLNDSLPTDVARILEFLEEETGRDIRIRKMSMRQFVKENIHGREVTNFQKGINYV